MPVGGGAQEEREKNLWRVARRLAVAQSKHVAQCMYAPRITRHASRTTRHSLRYAPNVNRTSTSATATAIVPYKGQRRLNDSTRAAASAASAPQIVKSSDTPLSVVTSVRVCLARSDQPCTFTATRSSARLSVLAMT